VGREGGGRARGEREAAGIGRELAQPGERFLLLFFSILIFISYFYFFYLLSS
jgi:hypothetical protein